MHMHISRRLLAGLAFVAFVAASSPAKAVDGPASPQQLAALYTSSVDRALDVPADEVTRYATLAEAALARAGILGTVAEYVLVVDRDPRTQAALLLWRTEFGTYRFIGASPVSTGRPGEFDHFETPVGVFDHTPANPDFRAEGTFNDNGIRGYGLKGMRVFDFGWQRVPKGWGDRKPIDMRLQMHATDPATLEQRLGSAQSKGCIRTPASLNHFLDDFGVLDANYERAAGAGAKLWVLKPRRQPVADAGRYVIVVDTARSERPAWSPAPTLPYRRPAPARK